MANVVFTAQAFGFGPISKLLAIADSIQGVRKIFFGTDVALDLARLYPFDEVYELGAKDSDKILPLLKQANLFINVMDFAWGKLAKLAGCPYFLVDSLLWFWPELPDGVREADVYFCQNFFDAVAGKIETYQLDNARLIGAIVSNHFTRKPSINQVIVNFGGIENPHVEIGKNSNYPFIMLETVLPLLKDHFDQILVTGRERIMKLCRDKYPVNGKIRFAMLGQQEMLSELARSAALLTAPGIQTFYDAADKLPVFCLLPQNNSNVRNLNAMIKHGVIQHALRWQDLYAFDFDRCQTPEEEFELILRKLSIFENCVADQGVLQRKVAEFLSHRQSWPTLVKKQQEAVNRLGPNGVTAISEAANEVLATALLLKK